MTNITLQQTKCKKFSFGVHILVCWLLVNTCVVYEWVFVRVSVLYGYIEATLLSRDYIYIYVKHCNAL